MNAIYEKLKDHIGHKRVCVAYGDSENPDDICIKCEDCNEVLISAETFNSNIVIKECLLPIPQSNNITECLKGNHLWDCIGIDTGGMKYRCSRCGAYKYESPHSNSMAIIE